MRRALLACALALAACGPARRGPDLNIAESRPAATITPTDLPAFFDCLRESGDVLVSAHRGGRYIDAAENALATFESTLRHGPAFLEVDVARTRDDVLVLMHDETVDRTTDGTGPVTSLSLEAFQALRLRDGTGAMLDARPPTLREALDWADGRTVLELDIKRSVAFEDVVQEVRAAGAMGRVAFITYSIDAAARLAHLAPEALIYTSASDTRELDLLERRGVDLSNIVVWVGSEEPRASFIAALAARGVETRLGMFGEGRDYASARRTGVQMIAADDARAALRELDEADGAEGHAPLQCAAAQHGAHR